MTHFTRYSRPGLILGFGLLTILTACETPPPPTAPPPPPPPAATDSHRLMLKPASFEELPGWSVDTAAQALPALIKSCNRILNQSPDQAVGPDGRAGTVRDWMGPCGALNRVAAGDDQGVRRAIESWFTPWMANDGAQASGTFTGYYEPEVQASKKRHDSFTTPLLGRPRDLVTVDLTRLRPDLAREIGHDVLAGRVVSGRLDPYPSRSDIETSGLGDQAPVLAWLDDPVAAHILHIQGSGRLHFDDGTEVRVAVAATNGQRFVGLGRILADHNKLEAGRTMPEIREWLRSHPAEAKGLMAENPRYVFYRMIVGDGPIGAQGVPLTPGRSLAVDPRFLPLGAPLWLDTQSPSGQPIRRLVVAQDTGAAIKGPVRGDLFWGTGEEAFQQAGRMKSSGRLWLLLPRDRTPSIASATP